MLLSLSGFLFEDDYRSQSVSIDRFCRLARSSGYGGVELRRTQINIESPKSLRARWLDAAHGEGLTITCLTARGLPQGGADRDAYFDRYLELCRDLQCPLMKIGSTPDWLHRVAEKARAAGVTLAGNNHIGGPLETVDGTARFLDQVNHPNYALLYDSLHLFVNREDYLGCIPRFIARTRNILVHCVRPAGDDDDAAFEHGGRRWANAMADAAGVQDWPTVLSTFRQLGYDGPITVIENGWPRDQREHVARRTAELLHKWWPAA